MRAERPLTEKQQRVLAVVRAGVLAGRCPTVREIGAQVGVQSSCTVQRHLEALRRKGHLRQSRPYAYRSWELTDGSTETAAVRAALVRLAAAVEREKHLPPEIEAALMALYDCKFDPGAAERQLHPPREVLSPSDG